MRSPADLVVARRPDGAQVIRAHGLTGSLMVQRPDGVIVNDDAGIPRVVGSISQAWAHLTG